MSSEQTQFQIFAKPGGATCNLGCRYCYYLEKENLYPDTRSFRMTQELLELYIIQRIEATAGDVVAFSWHGGEPTILGVDYFRKIVSLQRRHLPVGKQIKNALVTNGTLLTDEWCRFLAAEGFAVGLSVDGPDFLHDAYRVTKGLKPTHADVMKGWWLLTRYGVPRDVLCVIHGSNVSRPLEVYEFFKEIGATYVGFLPLVERSSNPDSGGCSVPAEAYGSFLCTIFDEWVRNDIGRILIQAFDEAARSARGLEHSLCIFRETCGDIPVLEHNGDVYSCDHFVCQEHLLGNIQQSPLGELLAGDAHLGFGKAKRNSLPRYCLQCDVLAMCNGGCPKDRFVSSPDGEEGLNYLCAGYKKFFHHCGPVFQKLVPLWKAGASSERLMQVARGESLTIAAPRGRNDPCPCGSGRKYKKCCLGSLT